jgi:hypothetical protein
MHNGIYITAENEMFGYIIRYYNTECKWSV